MDNGFYEHPFHHLAYLAWPLALFVQYHLLRQHEEALHPVVRRLEHVFTLWLAVFLATRESAWIMDQLVAGGEVWPFVVWGRGSGAGNPGPAGLGPWPGLAFWKILGRLQRPGGIGITGRNRALAGHRQPDPGRPAPTPCRTCPSSIPWN